MFPKSLKCADVLIKWVPIRILYAFFFCSSWLELKAMLVRKNRKVAMKSKRRWRKFWGEDWVEYRSTVEIRGDIKQRENHSLSQQQRHYILEKLSRTAIDEYINSITLCSNAERIISTVLSR